jgi:uncharacterized protein with GYD domain
MSTYIVLLGWTDQGIRNVGESPKRLDQARELARGLGAEIKAFYMTVGAYDMVAVIEAPDDATVARLLLSIAKGGHVRTTSLKAFSEAEYREIIGALK